jgi:hypothetical protein
MDDYWKILGNNIEHETSKSQRELKKYVDTTVQTIKKQLET